MIQQDKKGQTSIVLINHNSLILEENMSFIDAHLHVFRKYSEEYPRPIHAGLAEADREVLADDLIKEMEKAGVDKAILVPLGPEDHYVAEVQREHPGKFAAVGIFVKERIPERTLGLLRCFRYLRQWLSGN